MNKLIQPQGDMTPLYNYWERGIDSRRLKQSIPRAKDSPARFLSNLEIATIRVEAPTAATIGPSRHGLPCDAAIRIAIKLDRGMRPSGWQLAFDLQQFYSPYSHAARRPVRGLEILHLVDLTAAIHGVSVTVDTPDPEDPRRFRRMRLRERLQMRGVTGARAMR